jgi:hypothetical protein
LKVLSRAVCLSAKHADSGQKVVKASAGGHHLSAKHVDSGQKVVKPSAGGHQSAKQVDSGQKVVKPSAGGHPSYLSSDERQNLGLHFVVLESTSSIFWGGQRF